MYQQMQDVATACLTLDTVQTFERAYLPARHNKRAGRVVGIRYHPADCRRNSVSVMAG